MESLSQQVKGLLAKNPSIPNKDLYKAFPNVRKNTLRHYKSKFGDGDDEAPEMEIEMEMEEPEVEEKPEPKKRGPKGPRKKPGKRGPKPKKSLSVTKQQQLNADKVRAKVYDFFDANPDADSDDLYAAFPEYSKNSLRGFKTSYFKSRKANKSVKPVVADVEPPVKRRPGRPPKNPVLKATEARLAAMEKQLKNMKSKKGAASESVAEDVKELEEKLIAFIAAKRKAYDAEIKSFVKDEISALIDNVKG